MSLVRIRPSLPTKPRVFPGFFLFIPSPKLSVRQPNGRFLIVPALLLSLRRSPPPKKNTLLPCSNLFRHLVSFSVLSGIIPHIKTFSRLISRRFSLSSKAPDANCLYSCLVVQKPKEKTEKTYIFFFGVTIFTTRIKTTKKNTLLPCSNLFRHLVSFSVLSGIIPHIKTFSRLISRRFSLSSKAPDANCLYSCLVVQKPKEKTEKTYIFFFGVTIFTTRIKTTKKNKNGPNKNPGETGVSICSKRYRKLFGSRQALNRSKRGKSQQYGGSADQNIYDTAQNAH